MKLQGKNHDSSCTLGHNLILPSATAWLKIPTEKLNQNLTLEIHGIHVWEIQFFYYFKFIMIFLT